MSLPSWERGLKSIAICLILLWYIVAPLVGAWIEINAKQIVTAIKSVAPLVGAWIEIVSFLLYPFAE